MNREETLKKFNTYSSLFLVLGVLDLAEFWQQGYDRSAPRRRFSCGFSPEDFIPGDCSSGVILAVLKFYVGIQGLRQVKGNARGDLHLKVARGTMILSMISLVLSLLMILKGGGDASDALLDLVAVIFLAQYVKFGKTLMTMK